MSNKKTGFSYPTNTGEQIAYAVGTTIAPNTVITTVVNSSSYAPSKVGKVEADTTHYPTVTLVGNNFDLVPDYIFGQ